MAESNRLFVERIAVFPLSGAQAYDEEWATLGPGDFSAIGRT